MLVKQCLRNAGREWIMSQDPDKYDIGYCFLVEKFGKGFDWPKICTFVINETEYTQIQKQKLAGLGYGYPFDDPSKQE